jgi:hypothetical protein
MRSEAPCVGSAADVSSAGHWQAAPYQDEWVFDSLILFESAVDSQAFHFRAEKFLAQWNSHVAVSRHAMRLSYAIRCGLVGPVHRQMF